MKSAWLLTHPAALPADLADLAAAASQPASGGGAVAVLTRQMLASDFGTFSSPVC
jgi:hypothetical protein